MTRGIAGSFLAWALLLAMAALLWLGLVRPFATHLADLEARREIAIAQVDRLEDRLSRATPVVARLPDDLTYAGLSAPLATAALLSYVTDAVARAGGKVRSSLGRPSEPIEGVQQISIQVDVALTTETLAALLLDIETLRPLAQVSLLDVSADRAVPDPLLPVRLNARIIVSSLLAEGET